MSEQFLTTPHGMSRLEDLLSRLERLATEHELHRQTTLSRLKAYESMLLEAVATLDRTRDSFRSRQLRDLRLRLVSVLRDEVRHKPAAPAEG